MGIIRGAVKPTMEFLAPDDGISEQDRQQVLSQALEVLKNYRDSPGDLFKPNADELLEMFELGKVADQLIESYSHGMRQKLSFASCFLHEPKIVIVDEPWVGLDPKNIRFVKNYLKERTKELGSVNPRYSDRSAILISSLSNLSMATWQRTSSLRF